MELGTTLTQYVIEQGRRQEGARGAFTALLNDVATACKRMADLVRDGELAGVLGAAGQENVQGEDQKKLDVLANEAFIGSMERSGLLGAIASEEMEHHYPIPERYPRGDYLLAFDPLDGSSNIDINGTTGTIFSITRHAGEEKPGDEDFLKRGREQVCAGYCLYSSASMLIITTGQGVAGFTLDISIGEFLLTHPDMRVPDETAEYAINAAYARHWLPPIRRYVEECQAGGGRPPRKGLQHALGRVPWSATCTACCAAAGCSSTRSTSGCGPRARRGKLRLLYEANPMGMLVEQAGGLAHTGDVPILDVPPESLHQRVPVMMGSRAEVQRLIDYHAAESGR